MKSMQPPKTPKDLVWNKGPLPKEVIPFGVMLCFFEREEGDESDVATVVHHFVATWMENSEYGPDPDDKGGWWAWEPEDDAYAGVFLPEEVDHWAYLGVYDREAVEPFSKTEDMESL